MQKFCLKSWLYCRFFPRNGRFNSIFKCFKKKMRNSFAGLPGFRGNHLNHFYRYLNGHNYNAAKKNSKTGKN